MSRFARWVLVLSALLDLAACGGGERYRYVDVQTHPAMAADQVAVRAYQMGYEVGPMQTDPRLGFELQEIHWLKGQPPAGQQTAEEQGPAVPGPDEAGAPPGPAPTTPPPRADQQPPRPAQDEGETPVGAETPGEAEPVEGVDYERLMVAQVEIHATDGGSRVAIRSGVLSANALAELTPGEPALVYEVPVTANPIQKTFAWDLVSHMGWRWVTDRGDSGQMADLDGSLRFGGRLFRFGGGDATPAPAYSLGLLAGLGAGVRSSGFGFMPAIVLRLDRQETAEPVAGQILPTGQRYSLDLSMEGMVGEQERSLVGRLECRHADTFGIYVAAGYQFEPEASPVISIGLSLGPMPMAAAGAMLLFIR